MQNNKMITLGIETSCDETAASVVKNGNNILSNMVLSSSNLHKKFGGVIPEIAQRFHLKFLNKITKEALEKAKIGTKDIDLVAVTYGPGLIGALLVGLSYAKSLSFAIDKPLIGINHLHAHLYSAMMSNKIKFPCIGLIVSGGHTALALVEDYDKYIILGQTKDDAAGEAFDKVANMLGFAYPGGSAIDKISKQVWTDGVDFPRSYLSKDSLNFSFSGLKTAVMYYLKNNYGAKDISQRDKAKIAAGFQESVVDVLVSKSMSACRQKGVNRLVIGGGVSQNSRLRQCINHEADRNNIEVFFPHFELCQDNAAMVAGLGYQLYNKGYKSVFTLTPQANLNL